MQVTYRWLPPLVAQVTRDAVERLRRELLLMPQAEIKTVHTFKPGVYERTIVIPAWTVLTGAAHKTPYRVRLERGAIAVNTDAGVVRLEAPYEFDAPAGVQRVGRVFDAETVWTDIYDNPDDCRDIAELESRLYVVPSCGLGDARCRDRLDFDLFREQLGLSESAMDEIVNTDDLVPMPDGYDVEVRESAIHGSGLFALRDFDVGELICPGRIDGKRTPAGRFTNHSTNPNAAPVNMGGDIHATATRAISAGDEILINYRDSMRVNVGVNVPEAVCLDG